MDILLKSLRLIDGQQVHEAADYFFDGKELQKSDGTKQPRSQDVIDCSGLLASTGWIDLRCFVGEPGMENRETLESLGNTLKVSGFSKAVILPNTNPVIQSKNEIAFIKSRTKDFFTKINIQGAVTRDAHGG